MYVTQFYETAYNFLPYLPSVLYRSPSCLIIRSLRFSVCDIYMLINYIGNCGPDDAMQIMQLEEEKREK